MYKRISDKRPTTVYLDESGISRQSPFLVLGALKLGYDQGLVVNQLAVLRDKANWRTEAKFSAVTRTTAHLYREAAQIVASSDVRFRCVVLDTRDGDPLSKGRHAWKGPAQLTIRTLTAAIWKHEIATAVIDFISVPVEINYEGYVTAAVNRQLGRQALISAVRMDSKACWGLQMADLFTGAVAHQYRQLVDSGAKASSPKGQTAAAVAGLFNVESLRGADTQKFKVHQMRHRIIQGRSEFSSIEVA